MQVAGIVRCGTIGRQRRCPTYSSVTQADAELARRVRAHLTDRGISVWTNEEDLEPDTQLVRAVDEAISRSRNVVFLLSDNANSSHFLRTEAAIAVAKGGKRLIPIRCSKWAEVPFVLRSFAAMDLSNASDRERSSIGWPIHCVPTCRTPNPKSATAMRSESTYCRWKRTSSARKGSLRETHGTCHPHPQISSCSLGGAGSDMHRGCGRRDLRDCRTAHHRGGSRRGNSGLGCGVDLRRDSQHPPSREERVKRPDHRTTPAAAEEQLRQERETFDQRKKQDARWFVLRQTMGWPRCCCPYWRLRPASGGGRNPGRKR